VAKVTVFDPISELNDVGALIDPCGILEYYNNVWSFLICRMKFGVQQRKRSNLDEYFVHDQDY